MRQISNFFRKTLPAAPLKLIAMESRENSTKVNDYIVFVKIQSRSIRIFSVCKLQVKQPSRRSLSCFGTGEAKGLLKKLSQEQIFFIMTDVCNHNYLHCKRTSKTTCLLMIISIILKRIISAAIGKSSVLTPLCLSCTKLPAQTYKHP